MHIEPEVDRFAGLREQNPEALLADGFEAAYIGFIMAFGTEAAAVYSRQTCLSILMERDGMSYEEAEEFFSFNVEGAYAGQFTPLFLETA